MRSCQLLRATSVLLFTTSGVLGGNVQSSNLQLPSDAAANKQAVVDIFTNSYNNYLLVLHDARLRFRFR